MSRYILAIDQSTSATKAVIFNTSGKLISRANVDHRQYYPNSGWVEHDPEEIYSNSCKAIELVMKQSDTDAEQIACLAITNQRETVVVWDRKTGKPVYNAIVWQCRRGADLCKQLVEGGHSELIGSATGLLIDPYFSATKIKWILDHVEGAGERALRGELACGTIDSWLIYNLTNGKVHATDHSNACRTMLFNIHTLKWDDQILDLLGIPVSMMPEVKYADERFGMVECGRAFPHSLPIAGVMGDSHAALFGQCCFEPGTGKATYGTGSSIMMNIGKSPRKSPAGLVTSIGFSMNREVDYVFEGNIHCTGDTVKWMTDNLELLKNSKESEVIATSVSDNGGVYFVPAFAGLGAPYWNNEARAAIVGMDRSVTKGHVVRAALEAIAYQVKDVIDGMAAEAGIPLSELRVDGGPTKNRFLMQFQSDMLHSDIVVSEIEEASALGVALMCGLSEGIFKDKEALKNVHTAGVRVQPKMDKNERKRLYEGWRDAVKRVL